MSSIVSIRSVDRESSPADRANRGHIGCFGRRGPIQWVGWHDLACWMDW